MIAYSIRRVIPRLNPSQLLDATTPFSQNRKKKRLSTLKIKKSLPFRASAPLNQFSCNTNRIGRYFSIRHRRCPSLGTNTLIQPPPTFVSFLCTPCHDSPAVNFSPFCFFPRLLTPLLHMHCTRIYTELTCCLFPSFNACARFDFPPPPLQSKWVSPRMCAAAPASMHRRRLR